MNPATFPERIERFAPLGIRFLDPVGGAPIESGLEVSARLQAAPERVYRAVLTGAGVYAFPVLPGIGGATSPPRSYTISVQDRLRRFQPAVFTTALPLPALGLYTPVGMPQAVPAFYLFPAAQRTATAGMATVRADLMVRQTRGPAQFAAVEAVVAGGTPNRGVADDAGRVAVLIPYPDFNGFQPWNVTVQVRYSPGSRSVPPGAEIPEIGSILGQAYARIWLDPDHAATEVTEQLEYRTELVLRSESFAEEPKNSALWIDESPT